MEILFQGKLWSPVLVLGWMLGYSRHWGFFFFSFYARISFKGPCKVRLPV